MNIYFLTTTYMLYDVVSVCTLLYAKFAMTQYVVRQISNDAQHTTDSHSYVSDVFLKSKNTSEFSLVRTCYEA